MEFYPFMRLSRSAFIVACIFPITSFATEMLEEMHVVDSAVIDANKIDTFSSLSTVVGEQQIKDLNANDLTAALRRTPGVVVSRFNPVGAFGGAEGGAVYVRGMGASRPGSEIKTYIDGVPFYLGTWGHPLIDLLPINGMQSIQVYKGPQPQKFGNTFAAIDLIPRHHSLQNEHAGEVRLSGGSYGTFIQQALLQGNQGDWDYTIAQGYARSDGHRKDADGELSNGMIRLGYSFNEHWKASLLLIHANNEVSDPGQKGVPSTKQGQFRTRGTLASISLDHAYESIQGSIKLYHNTLRGSQSNLPNGGADTVNDTTLQGIRWDERLIPWRNGLIQLGLDVDEIKADTTLKSTASSVEHNAPTFRLISPHVAISHGFSLNSEWLLTPSVGVRSYDHNIFGSETASHAGVLLSSNQIEFRANAARGVNYPGAETAILSSLQGFSRNWRTLGPEKMDHRELGMKLTPWQGSVIDFSVYRDEVENRYLVAFPPAVAMPSFINLGDYQVKGGELSWQQSWNEDLSTFAGLSVLSPSLKTLPYAPKQTLSLGAVYKAGAWRFNLDAQLQRDMYVLANGRFASAVNTERVGGFGIVNVRASRAVPMLGKGGEVLAAVENLFDKSYAYRPGYPMPGFFLQLGLNMSF